MLRMAAAGYAVAAQMPHSCAKAPPLPKPVHSTRRGTCVSEGVQLQQAAWVKKPDRLNMNRGGQQACTQNQSDSRNIFRLFHDLS